MTDTTMPPAMFDLDDTGDMTPPILEAGTLTPYGAHHGLGPGIWNGTPWCGEAHYGSLESSGRRIWIWHACSITGQHDVHKCDRCEETW